MDQRDRLRHRPHRDQRERRLRRAALGRIHGAARDGRGPREGRRRRRAQQLLQEPRARRAPRRTGACSTAGGSTIGSSADRADWTCHVGYGHAPEHISLHCESQAHPDQRRHGAAAHLDQRQRRRRRARGRSADALSRFDRAHARDRSRRHSSYRRTGCRSRDCTRGSSSCRRTTTSASPKRSPPAPRRRRAPSSSSRCSSSARSICTR